MIRNRWTLCLAFALTASTAFAQDAPLSYGSPIDLATAKKMAQAAEEEANKNRWPVAIAVVDSGGHLVLFQRLDNTQLGSVEVAIGKAKTAVMYRRPTKAFEDRLAAGGADLKLLKLPGLPLEGGLLIIQQGKIIGGIGVSGVQSNQDAQVAAAGLKAIEASPKKN
jgi:glc operon protein GlcG